MSDVNLRPIVAFAIGRAEVAVLSDGMALLIFKTGRPLAIEGRGWSEDKACCLYGSVGIECPSLIGSKAYGQGLRC